MQQPARCSNHRCVYIDQCVDCTPCAHWTAVDSQGKTGTDGPQVLTVKGIL